MSVAIDDLGITPEDDKLALRNLERRLWNAEHTYSSNRGELKEMVRAKEGGGRITRQEECCAYWQHEIDKFKGAIFKHCLKTGLSSETGWRH